MRGKSEKQMSMLVLMNPEDLISADHPLRQIQSLSDPVFQRFLPVFARTRFIGVGKTQAWAYLVGGAYNLLRLTKLLMNTD